MIISCSYSMLFLQCGCSCLDSDIRGQALLSRALPSRTGCDPSVLALLMLPSGIQYHQTRQGYWKSYWEDILIGGLNPSEKYESIGMIIPNHQPVLHDNHLGGYIYAMFWVPCEPWKDTPIPSHDMHNVFLGLPTIGHQIPNNPASISAYFITSEQLGIYQ